MDSVDTETNQEMTLAPSEAADVLVAQSLSENGAETLETVVVAENGSVGTNHSVDGAGAVRATPTPPGPRAGSFSWTVKRVGWSTPT